MSLICFQMWLHMASCALAPSYHGARLQLPYPRPPSKRNLAP